VKPAGDARVLGLCGNTYKLSNDKERIAEWIERQFVDEIRGLYMIEKSAPDVAAAARAAMEAERTAALSPLDDAFATMTAAESKLQDADDAKGAALIAIGEFRCRTSEEAAQKFRRLPALRDELNDHMHAAIFASLLPGGETLA
jgi:hypothetical protein